MKKTNMSEAQKRNRFDIINTFERLGWDIENKQRYEEDFTLFLDVLARKDLGKCILEFGVCYDDEYISINIIIRGAPGVEYIIYFQQLNSVFRAVDLFIKYMDSLVSRNFTNFGEALCTSHPHNVYLFDGEDKNKLEKGKVEALLRRKGIF